MSEQLLTSDERQEQQRLDAGVMGLDGHACCSTEPPQAVDPEAAASDDSAFTMSKVCRWCGCTNTEGLELVHLSGCSAGEEGQPPQQQQQQQPKQQQPEDEAMAAVAAGAGGSSTEQQLVELVSRYSYMTKFVALLNPGEWV